MKDELTANDSGLGCIANWTSDFVLPGSLTPDWPLTPDPSLLIDEPLVRNFRGSIVSQFFRRIISSPDRDALQMEGVVAGEIESPIGRAHARIARLLGQRESRRIKVVEQSVRKAK